MRKLNQGFEMLLIKVKDKKAALKSIEKGLSLNKGYPSTKEFNKLKEKVVQ